MGVLQVNSTKSARMLLVEAVKTAIEKLREATDMDTGVELTPDETAALHAAMQQYLELVRTSEPSLR